LVDRGAKLNFQNKDKGKTALMYACGADSGSNIDVVRILLSAGADPSIKDKAGKTALDWAESKKLTNVVQLLKSPPPIAKSAAGASL